MNLTFNRNQLLKVFSRLPMQARIISLLNRWNRLRLARLETPANLIFFVTNRCNAKCKHCFYWRNLNDAAAEISIDQVKKTVKTLRQRLETLMLTGGEPLLRDDIFEIIEAFTGINRTRKIHITTNGSLPEKLEKLCGKVLQNTHCELSVQISLDGNEEYHNALRGGNFYGHAIESLSRLKPLATRHKNFIIGASTTLNKDNVTQLDFLASLMESMGIPWGFSLMRGTNYGIINLAPENILDYNPKDNACLLPDLQVIRQQIDRFAPTPGQADLRAMLQNFIWENTLLILKERRSLIKCTAGKADGVLYPNADVALCEITKPFANLHDFNFDFHRLWNSQAAAAMRIKISHCACMHGCHMVDSMKYDYRFILRPWRTQQASDATHP